MFDKFMDRHIGVTNPADLAEMLKVNIGYMNLSILKVRYISRPFFGTKKNKN